MATISEIQQLYVAYFGRPADPEGLDYWFSTGITTKNFAAAMYAQPEFQQVNAGLTVSQQVNALYVNLFGRDADVGGLTYWTQQINTGKLALASIANDLIYAANNSTAPQSVIDKAALNSKTATALAYTSDVRETSASILAYNPTSTTPWVTGPQFASANAFLDTATATNIPTVAAIQASVDAMTAITPPGQTFTLTTDKFSYIGGTGNDTFLGGLNAAGQQTLLAQDAIVGGGGTNTLIATIVNSVTPASISNIQIVDLTFQGLIASVVNLSNATGITTLTNNGSSGNASVSGLSTSTAVVSQNTSTDFVLGFAGVTGTSDSAALTLSGVNGGTTTIAGIETLTLTSSGSTTNVLGNAVGPVLGLVGTQLTTLNVGGTAGLTINGALTNVTTVNQLVGGSLSGALNLTFAQGAVTATGGAGNDTFTVNGAGNANLSGGLGNDTFVFGGGFFTAADTVTGGDGTTDTLQVDAAGAAIANTNITGVEILAVSGAVGATLNTGGVTSGINTVNLLGGTDGGGTTVTGPAGTLTLNLGSSTVGATLGAAFTVNDTGVATTDVLNLNNANAATNALALRNLVFGGYETVNLATGSGNIAQTVGAITLTPDGVGTGVLNISGANSLGTALANTGAITATTINASGLTGTAALVMGNGTVSATSITGTGNADRLVASAAGTLIEAGAGADTVIGGTGNDTLRGGAGNDTITAGTGNDTIDGGEGNDRIVLEGNLTAADTVDGGAGANTAVISAAVATAAIGARLSNIQTLETSAAAQDMSVFGNTTITTIAASDAALAVTNAGATLNTFNIIDSVNAIPVAVQITSSFRRATDTSTNALTVNANRAVTAGSTLAVNDEETITVNAANFAVDLDLTNAVDLTTLNITASGNDARNLVIDALGATKLASATFSGINSLSTVNLNAAASNANLTATVDSFAATLTSGTGADSLTGGALNDRLEGNNGADTLSGGVGNDTLIGGQGADQLNDGTGTDDLTAGTGADVVNLTSDSTADTIRQGVADSLAATGSDLTVNITAGDTLTYANGVDLINGFLAGATNGDVLIVDFAIAQSILGQAAGGLTSSGYLSGNYNSTTGVFTVTPNGAGADTAIVQISGGITNIVTNTSTVILRGVNSANLVNSNFGGNNTANIVPLYGVAAANVFSFQANSFATARLFIAANGAITPATQNVNPGTAVGFSQANMVTADFNNLLGGNGVTFNVAGATSTGLTSVRGSSGDDVIIEATEVFGAAASTINGGAGNDTIRFTTYGTDTIGDAGAGLVSIENIDLTAGATSLTVNNGVNSVLTITNSAADSAATVALGTGAAHSFTTASTGVQIITVGQNAQNVTTGAGADDIIVTTTGLALTGNLNAGTGANTLTVTLANIETVNFTGATLTGTQTLRWGNANTSVVTIDEANLAAFTTAITGRGGVETLTLTSTGNGVFNFSNTLLTAVNDVTITNAGSNVTFQAPDVADLATLTGSAAGVTTVNFTNTTDISDDLVTLVDVVTIGGDNQTLTLGGAGVVAGNYSSITGSLDSSSNLTFATENAGSTGINFSTSQISRFDTLTLTANDVTDTFTFNSTSLSNANAITLVVAANNARLAFTEDYVATNLTLTADDFNTVTLSDGVDLIVSQNFLATTLASIIGTNGGANETLTANISAGNNNLTLATVTTVSDLASITVNDSAGNNIITSSATSAVIGITTINLSNGGADTINLNTPVFDAAIAIGLTVNGFTTAAVANQDVITGFTSGLGGGYRIIAAAGESVIAANSFVEINAAASLMSGNVLDTAADGYVETYLGNALGTYTPNTGLFNVVAYGSGVNNGNAFLYAVTTSANNQDITAANITVDFLGVINGVASDSFTSSNVLL